MTQIKDAVRITSKGKVKGVSALLAVAKEQVITCAATTCTVQVTKQGNFCSLPCATPAPAQDHVAPCPDMLTTCIDLECQVRKGLRQHLLMNVTEKDRPRASEVALARLNLLLNDSEHGADAPEFFIDHAIAAIGEYPVQEALPVHVQPAKAVIEATPKVAVRKPRTAKHQPRITDNKEHPVTEKITMTKAEMERAIKAAAEALVAERTAIIEAAPVIAAADKPVEVVGKKGGRVKVQRATAKDREYIGTVLPAIVVNEALTIPALEVGEESIDTLATPKVRSPYNKARYRLDATPTPLDKETTTFRSLIAEHLRIATLVGAPVKTKTKAAKAPKVAAVVEPTKPAKVSKKAKALMQVMGISEAEAVALVGK